ncbi:hypothetical protein D9M68_585960 [compost metagenome]
MYNSNIISHFLMEADLRGSVENPAWYFENMDIHKRTALDHLLLTQGWIGYRWNQILSPGLSPAFSAEKGNHIEGEVIGLFKKPKAGVKLNLLSVGKSIFFADTVSNKEGKFIFKDVPYLDSAAFVIKIKNGKDRTSGASISVKEFRNSTLPIVSPRLNPWYVNSDSVSLQYYRDMENKTAVLNSEKLKFQGQMLREVEIKGDKRLNDFIEKTAWDAKFFKHISEEELKKVPKKSLLDLLYERIPGFTMANPKPNFYVGNTLISHVMIDHINTHLVASGEDDHYNETGGTKTLTDPNIFSTNLFIFNTLAAADIKEIVVYKGLNYYLDITTRAGKGPWISVSRGLYVFRPVPFFFEKEFYSPKYSITNNPAAPDLRSTIFWEANVVTDENGKATVSFFTADQPANYSIRMEGTDLQGRFGVQKGSIKVQ